MKDPLTLALSPQGTVSYLMKVRIGDIQSEFKPFKFPLLIKELK